MENRKQLVIVPPMSEAFLKLKEVLVQIAGAEKIEITEIEGAKDLHEMMSSGQSLVIFSNAKNCALFLQENKALIAKFHTKVILLIPKEIPGKTLAKFVKSGLTEAIFEGSPPKTLFHKVKMHLRSIKSGSSKNDDKDQVVTSMLNPNRISNAINDISSAKQKLAALQDASSRKNNFKEGAGADNKGGFKENNNLKADDIGTNWNSKRKKYGSPFGIDNSATSFKNKREKNVYYPTKKKLDTSLKSISEYINKKNKLHASKANNLPIKKIKNEISLNLNNRDKNKNELANSDNLNSIEPPIESMDYGLGNKLAKKEFNLNEENSENAEFDQGEADASFADIYNKLNKNLEDIEIDLENNLDKSKLNPEDENKSTTRPDEDAGYRIEKKSKSFQKQGEAEGQEGNQNSQDEDEIKKNKFNKKPASETEPKEDALDDLSSLATEGVENDHKTKKILNEEDYSKKKKFSEENSANFDKEQKSYKIVDDNDDNSKRKENEDGGHRYGKERQDDIFIDMSGNNQERKSNDNETGLEDDGSNSLNLDDQESTDHNNSSKSQNEDNNDSDISLNKTNQENLEQDKNTNDNSNRGKVNNLDASLKTDDPNKSGYNWDNLVDKNKSASFDVRKNYQPQVDLDFSYLSKNVSEQTIDYRRIKKEFEKTTPFDELEVERHTPEEIEIKTPLPEEKNPKKVIELDVRGIEFSIGIVKLIYNKDTVDIDYFNTISKELISQYKAYAVFYTYETSSNKHLESFNTFTSYNNSRVPEDLKESWIIIKSNSLFDDYFTKTMPTWQCRDIPDKSKEGKFWEDIELPRWASNEMANKKIELVFPYFDGVDLMGTAIIFFPEGVNASREKSIMITLDTARTVFLNTIQRKNSVVPDSVQGKSIVDKIKKVLSFVLGFFSRNKETAEEELL